ncbi:MAG: Stealth CR1 domain-containing protein [Rickettsiales bacterium]|nr:Stealth CR1 domain-containing protein [Rickettsiales bacterium]
MKTNFPIDLVYLWVDGNDPKWIAKKNNAMRAAGRPVIREAVANERFEQFDELKYSLRSAEKFAPWINHIFIVTDNQIPAWFKKNPRVTIVDHTEIIPKKYLPTFNSSCIELFLHKIPGLAEHFLFANDDFFFGRPVSPDFFFNSDGNPIVIMQELKNPKRVYKLGRDAIPKAGNFPQARANAMKFAYDRTGIKFNLRFRHAIEPMRKSYLARNIDGADYDEFMRTTATTFRENEMIQRIVFPLLDYGRGQNDIVYSCSLPSGARTHYKKYISPRIISILHQVGCRIGILQKDVVDSSTKKSILKQLHKYKPKVFCLGYMALYSDDMRKQVIEHLEKTFPKKLEFEK